MDCVKRPTKDSNTLALVGRQWTRVVLRRAEEEKGVKERRTGLVWLVDGEMILYKCPPPHGRVSMEDDRSRGIGLTLEPRPL